MTRTAKTVTAVNHAQIDTAQSKFGGASGLFDGTDDYLSIPDSADWAFGTGNFTIDFWVRFNTLPASDAYPAFYTQDVDASNHISFGIYNVAGTQSLYFQWRTAGTYGLNMLRATTVTTGVWYHLAAVHSGGNEGYAYIFQDGQQVGSTGSVTAGPPDLAIEVNIGKRVSSSHYFNGWLDEFRVSKGVARWTSNFTPPTAPHTPDSYDVLLLPMDGADTSTTFLDCPCAVEGTINDRLTGTAISGATVELFKSSDLTHVGAVAGSPYTSESTGRYIFRVSDPAIAYFVRAFKNGSPNLFGVTDDNLVGA